MKYSKEFLEANARLKTLDEETLNDELNKMSFDELLEHRDYMIQQELGEENQLSEEEAQEQIEELLQMTREPSTDEIQPIKIHTHRTGKRIAVLIAAILIMVSIFTVAAVASKRDFSILNGIVRFEDGKISVKLSRNTSQPVITIEDLEADLQAHGFKEVKLPAYFYNPDWKCIKLKFFDSSLSQATFVLKGMSDSYSFVLYKDEDSFQKSFDFEGVENGETIFLDSVKAIYSFDHGNNRIEIKGMFNSFTCDIVSDSSNEKTDELVNTLKKGQW